MKITGPDKDYTAFMRMRVEEFSELWASFVTEGGDLSDESPEGLAKES